MHEAKWPEVIEMSSSTTGRTTEALRHVFAVHALPEQLISDNGAQFISDEFTLFMKENGIKHFKSAPIVQLQMDLQSVLFKLLRVICAIETMFKRTSC